MANNIDDSVNANGVLARAQLTKPLRVEDADGNFLPLDGSYAYTVAHIANLRGCYVSQKVLVGADNKYYKILSVKAGTGQPLTWEEDKSGTEVSLNSSTRQLTVAGTNITIPNATTVTDNLTTDSSTNALSAKQGKVLNDKMGTVKCSLVNAIYGTSFTTEAQADAYLDSLDA